MPELKAYKVSSFLASGGFSSVKRIKRANLDEVAKALNEHSSQSPWITRNDGYETEDAEDGTVVITFHGTPDHEASTLRMYRLILENCSYQVEEEGDPAREGRRLLRVVGGGV